MICAQDIIAEIGTDMTVFPTAAHLVSWAKWSPQVRQSAGKRKGSNATGRGNPYLGAALGEAGISAGNTQSFLGARYRKLTRRMPRKKALVATGNSMLTIIHALLSDPAAVYTDLGARLLRASPARPPTDTQPRQEPGTPRLQSHHRSHRPGNRRAHRGQLTTAPRTRRR